MNKVWAAHFAKWILLSATVGFGAGTLSAFFLFTLNFVTATREANRNLIWFLPVGGFLVAFMYDRYGRALDSGNNLILDEIHAPRQTVPFRMTPLILAGTLLTHLFGGSAGREGTAIQMGASVADQLAKKLKLSGAERTALLIAGMSAGFGSVFGVPFAGAIFGIEVLSIGHLRVRSLVECLVASYVGHVTVLLWGVRHTHYLAPVLPAITISILISVVCAGLLFGLCARAFSRLTHAVTSLFEKTIRWAPLRALVGGAIVVAGYRYLGTDRYAGLGVPIIEESLRSLGPTKDFLWKSIFTILTLGSGMKGGEVTPLLFIGSTLGNSLSLLLPVSFSVLSALGFVGVFAGAANTPLACTAMAMEIFSPGLGLLALMTCYSSYLVSGSQGIYKSQTITRPKFLRRQTKESR